MAGLLIKARPDFFKNSVITKAIFMNFTRSLQKLVDVQQLRESFHQVGARGSESSKKGIELSKFKFK